MLNNWLSPVNRKEFGNFKKYSRQQFGKKMLFHKDTFSSLENIQIALVGADIEEANAIRTELYQLEFPFRGLRIADLGNIRKKDHSFLIPVLKELLEGGILPIILGSDINLTLAQFQAYQYKKQANLTIVDEKIRHSIKGKDNNAILSNILKKRKPKLSNLGIIGFQSHFNSNQILNDLESKNFELARLGKVRKEMEETEPIIRNADLFVFNISALKAAEAPDQKNPSPSGFTTEEACQISRYAGLSDKLTSIGFYGFLKQEESNNQTAQVLSQLIWYFIDGFNSRKNDYPVSSAGLVEYIVEFKAHNHQVKFWKSKKSGRWWMEIPEKSKRKKIKYHMVPCSYQDYQQACQENFPDRLMTAYRRFE